MVKPRLRGHDNGGDNPPYLWGVGGPFDLYPSISQQEVALS